MPAAQDVLVSIVALGAAALIVWRVIGYFQPARNEPTCGNCPAKASPPPSPGDTRPMVFLKSPRR